METPMLDCISKYNFLQDYLGFTKGILVNEADNIPDNTSQIRLSVLGPTNGFTVNTNVPHSKVAFKTNGSVRSEVVSNSVGIAIFDSIVDFNRIHCAQIVSDANILSFSLNR